MNNRRTHTNIFVSLVNTQSLEAECLRMAQKENAEYNEGHFGYCPHGFVDTPKGIFAFSSEGIGYAEPITNETPYKIGYYPGINRSGGKHTQSCIPIIDAVLTPSELKQLATGNIVNLSDFIRSFGARLDSNYELWRETLEKAMKGTPKKLKPIPKT